MMKLFSQLSTDISIHALLAESDRCCPCAIIAPAISIHALLAESDLLPFAMTITALDFYPRSPCGERRYHRHRGEDDRQISIHALLAESDRSRQIIIIIVDNFYPRSPCGERQYLTGAEIQDPDFYPRSPCGERRVYPKI